MGRNDMRSIKPGLLAAVVLTAVLAPAGAASAKTITVEDGSGDAWQDVYNPETNSQEDVEAGAKLNVDVLKTVIKHTDHKLILKTSYSELKKQDVTFMIRHQLRFSDGPKIGAAVDTFGGWKGTGALFKNRSGAPIKCANLSQEIDYAANTIELNIPRTCLGGPSWVQVNSFAYGSEAGQEEGESRQFHDNALRAGSGYGGWTEKVRKD